MGYSGFSENFTHIRDLFIFCAPLLNLPASRSTVGTKLCTIFPYGFFIQESLERLLISSLILAAFS